METDRLQSVIDGLDTLLDEERSAVLDGDLAALSELLTRKEALLGQLEGLDGDEKARLDKLQAKASSNQALLDGSLKGLRAVADRLATLQRVRENLETYGSDGRKSVVNAPAPSTLEKRA